ncbi:glucose-1-phosphate thymidylyltransferase [Candidatus Bipolaricaulota bacterium]|nr:glucose-1-phosphate thymidylyltransferase [Candidatus Bipolaricaulota bacterium]
MKGVFLCAGKGTRMRPISYSIPKHLIPLANNPILQYNVEKVIDAGINEVGMVVSPDMESLYRETLGTSKWGASITYIHQENPRGLAHAVACARDFVGDDPFLVYLGDNLLQSGLTEMVRKFKETESVASILLAPVDDPERFGVAEIEDGKVVDLVEKPDHPPSDLAIVGAYLFNRDIFPAIERIEPSDRGELEITDAIAYLINEGRNVTPSELEGWWLDVGRPSDVLRANRVLLEGIDGSVGGEIRDSKLSDRSKIVVSENSRIESSELRGPIHVAETSHIVNSTLGPNVSIGKGVELQDAEVENAIIMDKARIEKAALTGSLIGANAEIRLPGTQVKTIVGSQARIVEW